MAKQERLDQIQRHLCDKFHLPEEQVEEMLPSFVTTLKSHMEKLRNALQGGDLVKLGRAGHTMKGALLNLGINDCTKIATEIEQCGKAEDETADYAAMIGELEEKLSSLIG